MGTTTERIGWTDKALMALPQDGRKYEVVEGDLTVSPTGFPHGFFASRLSAAIQVFVHERHLGVVVDSSTGFRMKSGDCLSPDVSFISKFRLRPPQAWSKGFFEGAPDLAAEILPPGESRKALQHKLSEYFANGTRLAWVFNPKDRSVEIHTPAGLTERLGGNQAIGGGLILPGFALPLQDFFQIPDFGD